MLVDSTAGPIAAIAPRDSYEDVVLGFEIVGQATDGSRTRQHQLATAAEFPHVLAQRVGISGRRRANNGYVARSARASRSSCRPPGNPAELTVVDSGRPPHDDRTVRTRTCFSFMTPTSRGSIRFSRGKQVIERFAVNLFDRAESDIRVRPSQDPDEATARGRRTSVSVTLTLRPRRTGRRPARSFGRLLLAACPVRAAIGMVYLQPSGVSSERRRGRSRIDLPRILRVSMMNVASSDV